MYWQNVPMQTYFGQQQETFWTSSYLACTHTWDADILAEDWWSQDDWAKVITVMWSMWSSRNRWAHRDQGYDLWLEGANWVSIQYSDWKEIEWPSS
jgi:hypothetical protein